MNDTVLLTRDGPVATLTLNRPSSLNTLDEAMIDALVELSSELATDDDIRCIVINGAGKHFMAGGDVKMFGESLTGEPDDRQRHFAHLVRRVQAVVETLQRMPKPIVASVRGAVAGFGLSLMCACDLVVASDTSYFTSAYRHIGLTPDGGLSYFLPRMLGSKKAMEILLLGERFDAAEALRIGLISRVVPDAELGVATAAVTLALAQGPVAALRRGKRLLNDSWSNSLTQQLDAEVESFAACAGTDDFIEGIDAFLNKRAPRFGSR